MKTLTSSLIVIFACTGLALTALAGPEALPIRDAKDKEVMASPAPPPCTWTGFYVGVNGGYAFSSSDNIHTKSDPVFVFAGAGGPQFDATITDLSNFEQSAGDNDGFIGGGQIGYNRQIAHLWVVGVETDIEGVADNGSSSIVMTSEVVSGFAQTVFQTARVSRSMDYLGTVRGRLGILACSKLLLYGTGGLAYGGVNASTNIAQELVPPGSVVPEPFTGIGSISDVRVGWAGGGGLEWLFACHWSLKIEYLHYDLGDVTYRLSPLATSAAAANPFTINHEHSRTSFEGDTVRGGLNFHF